MSLERLRQARQISIGTKQTTKAVKENLEFIERAIPHALELLSNSVTDCASPEKGE